MGNFNITLYYNAVRQNPCNTKYPYRYVIHNSQELENLVINDHVCAEYKESHRKIDNFIQSDCSMFDVDNTDSDNSDDWITPESVREAFPDVPFYVSYSRNHMKEKDGKAPRPKFHVYFPDKTFTDKTEYKNHKNSVCRYFTPFDPNAKDSARFFYGVEQPKVEYYDGDTLLFDFMQTVKSEKSDLNDAQEEKKTEETTVTTKLNQNDVIPQGQRHNTLLKFAERTLKRYGENNGESYKLYIQEAGKCSPLLGYEEVQSIWNSALKFYNETIITDKNYIPPQRYNNFEFDIIDGNAFAALVYKDTESHRFNIEICRIFLRAFGITIKLNDMNNRHEIRGLPSKFNMEEADMLLETLLIDTAKKLSYKSMGGRSVRNALNVIANENHYHPVLELLNNNNWDGTDRLEELYQIMGITNDFYNILIKKWLLQTIAVLYNNSKNPVFAENMLVLQGEQGVGKTHLLRHLAIKNEFFLSGAVIDMRNKDSLMSATKVWICELGELDSTTNKKQSAIKGFLSKQTDNFREPYAPKEIYRPRRTSFCGTVNPSSYLTDETGNRRFWTIPIDKIDLQKVFDKNEDWYIQLWKQIQVEYETNPNAYFLTEDEQVAVNSYNMEYETLVLGEDEFMTKFNIDCDISCWNNKLTAAQIAQSLNEEFPALHISSVNVGKQLIPKIERNLGIKFRRMKSGKQYIFCPPFSIEDSFDNDDDTFDVDSLPIRDISENLKKGK